jgi:hypothetical protein
LRTPLLLVLVLLTVNLAVTALWAASRLLPGLVLIAAVVVAYRLRRGRAVRPRPPKVIRGRVVDAEVIRLRAEVEVLRAERDQARQAARAAWEASTEPGHGTAPPGPGGVTCDQLLADPRSGARPLGGPR